MRRSAIVALITIVTLLASPLSAYATISDKRNDYNGDGISDLVAITGNTGCLVRWSFNGSGGIGTGVQLGNCTWRPYAGSLAAPGDLNRDGVGDIVAIHSSSGCLVRWLGNGSGGFGGGVQLGTCTWDPYEGRISGAGDLNNDGNGDIVAINSTGCLVRWLGNGSGGFGSGVQLGTCSWDAYERGVTGAGDLNNDGNGDIVAISSSGCLVRWLGNGGGGFGTGVQLGNCTWGPYLAPANISGMGTLNGDGHGDIVAINLADDCLVRWLGNGNGGFGTGVSLGCTGWVRYFLAA